MSNDTIPHTTKTVENTCSDCGSSTFHADHLGFCVCTACGLVQDQEIFDFQETFTLDERGNPRANHSSIRASLGTNIGTKTERRGKHQFQQLQRLQNITRSNVEPQASAIFQQLKAVHDVFLSIDLFMDDFRRIYPNLVKKSKSRNIPLLCNTIFITVCKAQLMKPTTGIIKALQIFGFELSDYYTCKRAIQKACPKQVKFSMDTFYNSINVCVGRIAEEFGLEPKFVGFVQKLISAYRQYLGEKPEIIAASAIAVGHKLLHEKINISPISIPRISKILEITASTIYTRIRMFPYAKVEAKLQNKRLIPAKSYSRALHFKETGFQSKNKLYSSKTPRTKGISKEVYQEASQILVDLCKEWKVLVHPTIFIDGFRKVYSLLTPKSKVRNVHVLSHTLFYTMCKHQLIALPLNPFFNKAKISIKSYYSCLKAIIKVQPLQTLKTLQAHYGIAKEQILNLINHFDFSQETKKLALVILKRYRYALGEKPTIAACTALSITLQYTNDPRRISVNRIAQFLHVTPSTVYHRVKYFPMKKLAQELERRLQSRPPMAMTASGFTPPVD